ncbi:MAG: hypothetical protein KAH31_10485, partial [Candidatus Sabulitectum sp.]|nr:hypothetical protein [Candidatus Sabulitectum sp.]
RTEYERAIEGIYYLPLEKRSVLIDIESGFQVTRSGIAGIGYLGGNGYGIASYGDSIRFYDNNLNLVKQVFNRIANTSHYSTSFAIDGSMMVTRRSDTYDDLRNNATLRAYDCYGNVLWDAEPSEIGGSGVSENGQFVYAFSRNSLMRLDGKDGSLFWEEPIEDQLCISTYSRRGCACAFETDLPPEGVRENLGRERFLYVVTDIADGNIRFNRISFFSRSIGLFSCVTVNESGSSLWRTYFGEGLDMDLSKYELCFFTEMGELLFVHRINGHGNIRNGLWRNTMDLKPNSIDSIGNRIIWFEESVIHILTLQEEGIS